ncbi:hypothetical protein NC803_01390 [Brenneria sp. KBI 447]|uniref:Uncharacterized protein n=1 Tax=Brenneria izbisi TaxID=2939450 RepID=A0AA42C1J6_9GAMM|nr:hypothetical protein [Brenneria izbisi]MCV9877508.1 hypothetical protein [Brenneria izbisi]
MPANINNNRNENHAGFYQAAFYAAGFLPYCVLSAPLNPAERNEIQQRQTEVIEQARQQHQSLLQLWKNFGQ